MGTTILNKRFAKTGEPPPCPTPHGAQGKSFFRSPRPTGWLQFESGWLDTDQILKNLETMVSLLQKTQEGLMGIDQLLNDAVAHVNECWNKGDKRMDPPEKVENLVRLRLGQMDEIARQCRFHGRGLLDGQSGVTGAGKGVTFIRGGPNTRSSPEEGYAVDVQALPGRTYLQGGVALDDEWVRAEQEIFLAEGEYFIRYPISPGETVASLIRGLREETRAAGMDLEIGISPKRKLIVRHNQYGSQYKFKGCSFKTPLLSKRPGKVEWSRKGRDIQGTIGGEPAFGIGRMMVGYLDNEHTSELSVAWLGGVLKNGRVGSCQVAQNALEFQDGTAADEVSVRVALPSFLSTNACRWMDTHSGFGALSQVAFGSWQELRDSLHLLYAFSFEIEDWKERVSGWIKRYQNQALACLRKGRLFREHPEEDERVTAHQAERMAHQLKEMIQGGLIIPQITAGEEKVN